jgi:hypothetical protein
VNTLDRVEEESSRGELVDDLMAADTGVKGERKAPLPKLRAFWHAATRGRYWPVTIIVMCGVLGGLIYVAVGLIAEFFAGIVE